MDEIQPTGAASEVDLPATVAVEEPTPVAPIATSSLHNVDVSEPCEWSALASEIAQRAAALSLPDAGEVDALATLVTRLGRACERARAEAAEKASHATRREILKAGLESALGAHAADLLAAMIDAADASTLTEAEAALPSIFEDARALTETTTARAARRDRLAAAVAADSDDVADLAMADRDAKAAEARARAAVQARLDALRTMLSQPPEAAPIHRPTLTVVEGAMAQVDTSPVIEPEPASASDPAAEAAASTEPVGDTAVPSTSAEANLEVEEDDEEPTTSFEETAPVSVDQDQGQDLEAEAADLSSGSIGPIEGDVVEAPNSVADAAEVRIQVVPEPVAGLDPAGSKPPAAPSVDVGAVDRSLLGWLSRGEVAIAGRLASLASDAGLELAFDGASLQALAVAPSIMGPNDVATTRLQMLLGQVMSAITAADQTADSRAAERARMVGFAALLRPALFDIGSFARSFLEQVPTDDGLAAVARLKAAVVDLGPSMHVSAGDLARFASQSHAPRAPEVRREVQTFLDSARSSRHKHHPTTAVWRALTATQGKLGQLLEMVIADDGAAEVAAQDWIDELRDDRSAQEAFLDREAAAHGRPDKDPIFGHALTWFCDRLQESTEVLGRWLDAVRDDAGQNDNRRQQALRSLLSAIDREAAKAEEALARPRNEDEFASRARLLLLGAVQDIRALVGGKVTDQRAPRARDLLSRPLLRLWDAWPDPADTDLVTDAERPRRKGRLLSALLDPSTLAASWREAFEARRVGREFRAARAILLILSEMEGEPAAAELLDDLDDAVDEARVLARDRVDRLVTDLSTFLNLDTQGPAETRTWLVSLDLMRRALDPAPGQVAIPAEIGLRDSAVPPDFPDLDEVLDEASNFRDALRVRILDEQRKRLERLADRPDRAALAQDLLSRMGSIDPITLDSLIGQVQQGLTALSRDGLEDDVFSSFFPSFVEAMAAKGAPDRGRIISAIQARQTVGPIDASAFDDPRASAARALVQAWVECESFFAAKGRPEMVRARLADVLNGIGFVGATIGSERQISPGKLRSFQMTAEPIRPSQWFLPPAFGSKANGHYGVLLATSDVSGDQLSSQIGQIGHDVPSLLIIFGRLDVQRRTALAHVLRRDRRSVLLIDETLLIRLATTDRDPLETLFACTAPFGWMQPYTTDQRVIPPEMFFGRKDEIAAIVARQTGGSLVYGGRQLGKSALLNHVKRLYDRPPLGERAVYVDIRPLGGRGAPAQGLWAELGHELAERGIVTLDKITGAGFRSAVERWLSEDQRRRLLVMLDEADNFLTSEKRESYPNIVVLKRLMEDTSWRFKVVFAGLHNVRRFAYDENSPLFHMGEPICVGPLDTTPENLVEARRMVMAPMRAAGYAYAEPGLALGVLSRVNYYPSLVQVFCKIAIETAAKSSALQGGAPPWTLGREQLFEGRAAQNLTREIRERFDVTIRLDMRYELVAKALALHMADSVEGNSAVLREGLGVSHITGLVQVWWPKSIEVPRLGDIEAVLAEMVDLGVLTRLGRDRFGFRNAQIAQMLGMREEIEDDLLRLTDREPEVSYDAGRFHARVAAGDPDRLSPATDRVLAELLDAGRPGLRLFAASPALWGRDLGARLAALASGWGEGADRPTVIHHRGVVSKARDKLDRLKGRAVFVLEGPWDEKGHDYLAKQDPVRKGVVLPVVVAEASDLLQVLPTLPSHFGDRVHTAQPWGEAMLRHWLEEQGLRALDDPETRRAILEVTAGVPERLIKLRGDILKASESARRDDRIAGIEAWGRSNRLDPAAVGLDPSLVEPFAQLAKWAVTGALAVADAAEILGGDAATSLAVFRGLGLVRVGLEGSIEFTRLGRLLADTV